jgi:hypothetical protein
MNLKRNMNILGIFSTTSSTLGKKLIKSTLTIPKFNFASKVYNSENLRFQKTFKFTKNSEKQKEIKSRGRYQENLIAIKELELKIKDEEYLMYTSAPGKNTEESLKVMKRDKEQEQLEEVDVEMEELKPVNIAHKNKKMDLEDRRRILVNENESIKSRILSLNENNSTKNKKEDGEMRISYIRDVFSYSFTFGNKFLNPNFFEGVNKVEDEKPWSVKKEEIEVDTKQSNLENEIGIVLDQMIEKEMKTFDISHTPIPHKLASKPLLRSIPADLNQPPVLLVEGDLNCNYDLNLEYERLFRLTKNDDFGQKIKEDQDKEDEKDEAAQDEEKDFFNSGNQPNTLIADTSMSI